MTTPAPLHERPSEAARAALSAFRIVLLRPSHAGNIGSVARAMRVMGLRDLVVVAPREASFAQHPEARAFASSATDVLEGARAVTDLRAAVADCERVIGVSAEARDFGPVPAAPECVIDEALADRAAGRLERVALVFGTERTGFSIAEMAHCQRTVSIPADPEYASLNLSQAVQVLAYVVRQRVLQQVGGVAALSGAQQAPAVLRGGGRPEPDEVLAGHAAIEGLHEHLERALIRLGFLDPRRPRKLMPRLRRLFGRTDLTRAEVELLRGVCTHIERAVPAPEGPPRQTTSGSGPGH